MKPSTSRAALLGATVAGLLMSGCQQAYFRALNLGLARDLAQSVEYDPGHGLSLDIYRPQGRAAGAPVVVFFHGGSWRDGNRGFYRFVGDALARHGVLVVIPDYRKAPGVVFPAFMEDAARATAWAHRHAAEFGGDPSSMFLIGHSAGAHIVALLATDGSYLAHEGMQPRQLAGVVGLAGPYVFLPITYPAVRQVFGREADWPRSQPINFVDGNEPPFLLLHGGDDRLVLPGNSERFASRLRAAGDEVELRIVPGIGHIGLVNGFYSARFSPALRASLDWIDGEPGPPLTRLAPAPSALPVPR
jgi:acetyl esterase/lipase